MSKKILIVDDAPFIREILVQFLQTREDVSEIREAEDGEEAVEIFENFKPDLIFMDIVMPKLSGIEATKRIRSQNSKTPIIGLSTLDQGDVINRLLKAGANSFVKKPFSIEELIKAFEEQFK
jgi:two-component system chemotaxis response regulator CheY